MGFRQMLLKENEDRGSEMTRRVSRKRSHEMSNKYGDKPK